MTDTQREILKLVGACLSRFGDGLYKIVDGANATDPADREPREPEELRSEPSKPHSLEVDFIE